MNKAKAIQEFAKQLRRRDNDGVRKAMDTMDRFGCWRECISHFNDAPMADRETGSTLIWLWRTYGFRIMAALKSDITVFVDALRLTLPQYAGSGMTLYRGELEERHRAGVHGIAWTSSFNVAEMFANRRAPDEGLGVVLRIDASTEMIIAGPNEHSHWLEESEYVVDPRKIKEVEVCKYADGWQVVPSPLPSLPATINKVNQEFWQKENTRFQQQMQEYPDEISAALLSATRLINHGHTTTTDFIEEVSVNAGAYNLELLRKKNDSARRKRGAEKSGKARTQKNAVRDQRIHDATAAGKTPQQIAGDQNIFVAIDPSNDDLKKQEARQKIVYRILKARRPE